MENNSGQGDKVKAPDIVAKKFNWGCFLGGIIWLLYYRKFLIVLFLILSGMIPFVGVIVYLVLWIWTGIKGNEWAWQSRYYNSVEEFHEIQKKWATAGVIVLILWLLIVPIIMFTAMKSFLGGGANFGSMNSSFSQSGGESYQIQARDALVKLNKATKKNREKGVTINSYDEYGLRDYFSGYTEGSFATYEFVTDGTCASYKDCHITVDVNGSFSPNEKWITPDSPSDIIEVPMKSTNDGHVKVFLPIGLESVFTK